MGRSASLASLLVCAAASPLLARGDDAAAKAIEKLKAAGAIVLPLAQGSDELSVNFAVQGAKAGDAEIAALKEVPKVVELNLGGTKVTDAGMKVVGALADLRRLQLQKTAIGDAGIEALKELAKLESLNLYATKVTDAALVHVQALKGLKKLYLWQTGVTDEGVSKLKAARASLEVNTGAPPPLPPPKALTCCEKASAEGKACDHPCCKAAAEKGRVCFKCNPEKAATCCEKAEAEGKECDHPCCVEARKAGKLCEKCNPGKK